MILDFYDGESISRIKSGIQKHPHHSYKVRFKHKIITVSPPIFITIACSCLWEPLQWEQLQKLTLIEHCRCCINVQIITVQINHSNIEMNAIRSTTQSLALATMQRKACRDATKHVLLEMYQHYHIAQFQQLTYVHISNTTGRLLLEKTSSYVMYN